jgi:hypothetical protein
MGKVVWVSLLIGVSFFFACTGSTKKDEPSTSPRGKDSMQPTAPHVPHTPDPTIAVKDDYSQLTEADFKKEDPTSMDMAYFPSNYALEKASKRTVDLKIRVIYSRPKRKGRTFIFGEAGYNNSPLVPYGEIWRLGANETTEVEFFQNVKIGGTVLKKGRYSLYALPYADTWKLIVNSTLFTWGDYNYDSTKNKVVTSVPVEKRGAPVETFYIFFQRTAKGANMIMTWDYIQVALPIEFL